MQLFRNVTRPCPASSGEGEPGNEATVLQLRHQFCGDTLQFLVAEGNDAIDDVEGNLGLDEDVVWEDIVKVEEGVLTMEED